MPEAGTDQSTGGGHFFKITLGGAESAAFFKEVSGIGSENEVIVHTTTDASGKPMIQKFPGQANWQNINLKRGIDSNNALWTWREQVVNGQITEARKDGTIEVLDWTGAPIVTYSFVRGWPCKYSAPALTAGGNEVMIEEIEIAHEGMTRA
jgi:phage tail-like protein